MEPAVSHDPLADAVTQLTNALVETEIRRREDMTVLVRYLAEQMTRVDALLEEMETTRQALVTISDEVRQYHEQERTELEKGRPVLLVVDQNHRASH